MPSNEPQTGRLLTRIAHGSPSFAMLWCFVRPRENPEPRTTLTEKERCDAIDEALAVLGGSDAT